MSITSRREGVIVGAAPSRQAKRFEDGTTSLHVMLEAAQSAIDHAGMNKNEIDGILARWPGPGGTHFHPGAPDWAGLLGIPIRWGMDTYPQGVPALATAKAVIEAGLCTTVLIVNGQAGSLTRSAGRPAPWTQPMNEFVAPFGSTTPAQFALIAKAYDLHYGLDEEALAYVSAGIRNYGHVNPEALMYRKGPHTVESVLSSPYIAEPLRLMNLCLATEGAAALIVTSAEKALSLGVPSVRVLASGMEYLEQQYVNAPDWRAALYIGSSFARNIFAEAGIELDDIDIFSLYDANAFEIVRQFEVFGFCDYGEGGSFLRDRGIGADGLALNTDGGLLSHSHPGFPGPTLKIVEAVRQLRGEAGPRQVDNARTAIVSGAGSGAQYFNAAILGRE